MKNDYICQFGNCSETGQLPVVITDKTSDPEQRPRFCGRAHAIAWLMHQMEAQRCSAGESARLTKVGIVRIVNDDYGPRGRCGGGIE
jgi:hypothetical protein